MLKIFFSENLAVNEIAWKNMVDQGRLHMTIKYDAERMHFACRITKAYIQTLIRNDVIFIVFPRKQWLHECASMVRYAQVHCVFVR